MPRVTDPFNAAADPMMPHLAIALDPECAETHLKRGLPRLSGPDGLLRIREITVLRHKPGKRCIVQYRVRIERGSEFSSSILLIGKTRAKRFGQASYRLQQEFWDRGFSDQSPDDISVPEPLGHIAEMEMWFQRKISGDVSTGIFTPAAGLDLAPRIAEAACKIHQTGVKTSKMHGIDDELRILDTCFESVYRSHAHLKLRLEKLWRACVQLRAMLENRAATGIHRDFYSDQVILRKRRLYIIDFDLYCQGDPALDIGNFTAHLTEMALRLHGSSAALKAHESAITQRFLELGGDHHAAAIQAYHALTLARHIFLSTQFEERRHLTEQILVLCEELLYSNRTR
jgi:thiamine kinase-like enzyme